jgi:hypothetical protein
MSASVLGTWPLVRITGGLETSQADASHQNSRESMRRGSRQIRRIAINGVGWIEAQSTACGTRLTLDQDGARRKK